MFIKFFKKAEQPPELSEEQKNKDGDIQMGMVYLKKKEPYVAKEFFKKGGLSPKEAVSRLTEAARESIESDPLFAADCLRVVGFSEEETKPLFELAKFLKEKEGEKHRKSKKERELAPDEKLNLRDFGLTLVAKDQKSAAEGCFRKAGEADEDIESLLNLNLVDVEKEKEKIKKELAKIRREKGE